jgi:transcriptional regulator with XRE-family HTH domain
MTDETTALQRSPNPVDLHVGGRIRMRRKVLGVSQERLAEALGLTFQQVQKYERGANRVSASKLYEIARFLAAPIAYFFEGLADPTTASDSDAEDGPEQFVHDFRRARAGCDLPQGAQGQDPPPRPGPGPHPGRRGRRAGSLTTPTGRLTT